MGTPEPADLTPSSGAIKGEAVVHELSRAERAVVRRSSESRATVPDLELEVEARLPDDLAPDGAVGALLARACAVALREHPRVNAAYRDGRVECYSRINLGVVIAAGDAYVIPTVFDADRKSRAELAAELDDLSHRALQGQLLPPELAGGTFTLWPAGALGLTRAVIPVVPPQVAVLTAGAVRTVPSLENGRVLPQPVLTLVLSCDHRALYGTAATRFLQSVRQQLEEGVS